MVSFMLSWIKTGAVLFALPIIAYFFLVNANSLQSERLRRAFISGISTERSISEESRSEHINKVLRLEFEKLCSAYKRGDSEEVAFVTEVGLINECKKYSYFAWAKLASLILIGMGIVHILLIAAFVAVARKSRQKMLVTFPIAWASSTLWSIIILVGQGVLAVATIYFASTLLFGVNFRQLLAFIMLAVGIALYKILRALLWNPSLASDEPTSEAVSEEAAPLLWQKVKEIAQKLGTTPPDVILVGMSTACYVTEFPVVHSAGVAEGRTLHLSAPMMQQLSSDEISAIIGHELGHFKGEDTAMTRRLLPRILKSENTLAHLHAAGFVGMPAFYAMLVFKNLFEKTISTFSRERELAADAYGASVTSREVCARALVRYCYHSEVYDDSMSEHMIHGIKMEEALQRFQDEYRSNDDFWKNLATHALPHPFDRHPPMSLRLEKLGFKVDDLRFLASKKVEHSAFHVFMGGSHAAIANAVREQQEFIEHVQEQIAVKMASEDELSSEVIAKHFPEISFKTKTSRIVKQGLEFFFVALLPGLGAAALAVAFSSSAATVVVFSSLALVPGFVILFLCIRKLSKETLVLNYKGLKLGSWKEQARFADINSLQIAHESSFFTKYYLLIHFEGRHDSFSKRWAFWRKGDFTHVNLSIFEGNPEENYELISRYFTRGLNAFSEIPENAGFRGSL